MDERTVSKARMSLATGGCPRIRAPARTRRVARWRRRTLSFSHHTWSPCALTPRKVDDGHQLISLKVQHTNPGLACSPDKAQIEVPGSGKRIGKRVEPLVSAGTVRGSGVSSPAFPPRSPTSASSSQFLSLSNHLFFPFPRSPLKAGCRLSHGSILDVQAGSASLPADPTLPPSFARFENTSVPRERLFSTHSTLSLKPSFLSRSLLRQTSTL